MLHDSQWMFLKFRFDLPEPDNKILLIVLSLPVDVAELCITEPVLIPVNCWHNGSPYTYVGAVYVPPIVTASVYVPGAM
jgi:hypothetical protein